MNVLVAHPTGNQFVRHLLGKLLLEKRLALYATSLGFAGPARWSRWLPASLAAEIGRRSYAVSSSKLSTHPWREAVRLLAGKTGLRRLVRHEAGWASVDAVYRDLDLNVAANLKKWVHRLGVGVVYGYEDGCAATFAAARELGLARIYDLPIAHWETSGRLLREEAERWPRWEPTLGATSDSPLKLERKTRELELADLVVCPSDFVADSLPIWARESKRVIVAPFGSPAPSVEKTEIVKAEMLRQVRPKLRVLFVGSMGQRKGLADLFAAIRLLKGSDVELVVMGSLLAPMEFYRRELPDFTYESGRPHDQVLALMRSCDVLCLPSIVEGRALVMQEAMSQGLPIVITRNTGGGDLVDEGETGFLVPIRSPETIARRLEWFASHRNVLPQMRNAAVRKAAHYTWQDYVQRIIRSLPVSAGANN